MAGLWFLFSVSFPHETFYRIQDDEMMAKFSLLREKVPVPVFFHSFTCFILWILQ